MRREEELGEVEEGEEENLSELGRTVKKEEEPPEVKGRLGRRWNR